MCICAKAVAVLEQNFLGQQSSYFIAQCDGQYWSWRSMLELLSWKHRETAICLLIADVFRYQCLSPLIVWLTVLQTICVFEWLQVGVCHSTLYSKNSLAYLKMQPTYNLFWVAKFFIMSHSSWPKSNHHENCISIKHIIREDLKTFVFLIGIFSYKCQSAVLVPFSNTSFEKGL